MEDILGRSICVIGPRDAGKTTYLAALAYWNENPSVQKRLNIKPASSDANKLARNAKRIICELESLEPTPAETPLHKMPEYRFILEIEQRKRWLSQRSKRPAVQSALDATPSLNPNGKDIEMIQLFVRDFGGEMFQEIGRRYCGRKELPDHLFDAFIKDCLKPDVQGCLILLEDWGSEADAEYHTILEALLNQLGRYNRTDNYRIALAVSKCERGELWTGRLDPEFDLFRQHLRSTRETLLNSNRVPIENIGFFAISTFGVLARQDPRPNRKTELGAERRAVLRETGQWQPYGLFEPLYWLSTGKRMVFE